MKTLKVLSALLSYPTAELMTAHDELCLVLEQEAERRDELGIVQVSRLGDVLARVGAGRANHDALAVPGALEHIVR